jgi:class 3 adenylate cyclase/tetratricopeptide (TPR) repeat protein
MFCDIVDYTRLAARIDEEELHRLIATYQGAVADIVSRWDGDVDFYAGDGVSACFGYPRAHEDDAERAVRAGLDVVQAMRSLMIPSETGQGMPLPVRVGIHSGRAMVGELGSGERRKRQPIGTAMNVAARLQAFAQAGTVVISHSTEQLVSGRFLTEDIGGLSLKGMDAPVRAYVIRRGVGTTGQTDAHRTSATPVVGRSRELARLQQCWSDARAGRGQVVLVSGEPGIGKSKLVRRFVDDIARDDAGPPYEWRCSPFHMGTPLHPVVEAVVHQLGLEPGNVSRDEIKTRVESQLRGNAMQNSEALNPGALTVLIADVVSTFGRPFDDASAETPVVRRARMLHQLCEAAKQLARAKPRALVVEDLQWADPSTLELVDLLIAGCRDVPLVLLLTFRPTFARQWPDAPNVTTLALDPLSAAECGELLDAVVGDRVLPTAARTEVLARADGVPLFVEELTRAVFDRPYEGATRVLSTIPNTLHGPLASRIDNVSPGAHATIHLASAISRTFTFDLLAAVSDKSAAILHDDLDELVKAGLVYRSMTVPSETYVFRHALIAEAAYDSIVRSERKRLHGLIAHRLKKAFPSFSTEQPELLARHFQEADEHEMAIDHWHRAGEIAIAKGAYREAVQHLDAGLRLLDQLADTAQQVQRDVELSASRGMALYSMLGYAHPDVERTFARASDLCERTGGNTPFWVLYGLWAVHLTRSNRRSVEALLPRFVALADAADPIPAVTAHASPGIYLFLRGRFPECLGEMTMAAKRYSDDEHTESLKHQWYGGGLYLFAYRAWALAILGRAHEAHEVESELAARAACTTNPYSVAIADGFRVSLARDREDWHQTLAHASRQIEFTQRQMLPFWEGPAHCSRGWARAHLGDVAEGIAEIQLGLAYLDGVGLRATYAYHLSGLTEAMILAGDVTGALESVERGLAVCGAELDCFYEAELLRLKAVCLHRQNDADAALRCYRQALHLARQQSAALYAARAAYGLFELQAEQGDRATAQNEYQTVMTAITSGLAADDAALLWRTARRQDAISS